MTKTELPSAAQAAPSVNILLMVRQHAANEARALRRKIAAHEAQLLADRAELERLIHHAAIEGLRLDDDTTAAAPVQVQERAP
jgi:catechol-2,3-dioxygenase